MISNRIRAVNIRGNDLLDSNSGYKKLADVHRLFGERLDFFSLRTSRRHHRPYLFDRRRARRASRHKNVEFFRIEEFKIIMNQLPEGFDVPG